jgi:hypothetical protein
VSYAFASHDEEDIIWEQPKKKNAIRARVNKSLLEFILHHLPNLI